MDAIVFVHWLDAHTLGNEEVAATDVIAKAHKALPTRSAGWLIKSDERGVTLATDFQGTPTDPDDPPTWRNVHFIPRGMIVSEETHKPQTKRGKRRA